MYLQRVGLFLPPPSPGLANIHVVPRVFFTPYCIVTSTDKTASQPIAVSMPVDRTRRLPNIEKELGDCLVFGLTAIRVH